MPLGATRKRRDTIVACEFLRGRRMVARHYKMSQPFRNCRSGACRGQQRERVLVGLLPVKSHASPKHCLPST